MDKIHRLETFNKLMLDAGFRPAEVRYLRKNLDNIGFFVAPASTKYHGNYEGGLFDHSLAVTEALVELTHKLNLHWNRKSSPYIVGMFHDLCKCDDYYFDNASDSYKKKDVTLNGHGEKSVIIAQNITGLTEEEMLCIRWHMGAYDDKENWNILGRAIEQYPNVLYTHTADMIAARIKGI